MNLKQRITIAFLAIILIPVILTGVAFSVLTNYKVRELRQQYGLQDMASGGIYNNTFLISKMVEEEYEDLKLVAEEDSAQLEDYSYLNRTIRNFRI